MQNQEHRSHPAPPLRHDDGGRERPLHPYGRLGVPMVDDPQLLEPLAGEWAEVVLRIMHSSPEHWEAMTLLLLGLSAQVQAISLQLQELMDRQRTFDGDAV